MSADRQPISDYTITVVCYTIGGLSLIISLFCLAFARRLQPSCTKGVFAILVLLQILYTLHNFHFSVLFLPFLYIEVGGGYCIGLLCEPHHLDFATNVFRHTADWVEHNRNFGVIPKEDGDILELIMAFNLTHITAFISAIYSLFAVVCSIHIVKIIYTHNQSQSSRTWATTIKQTRQSMILVANFVAFITVPIALMVSLPIRHLEDDSIVFLPCIFLCSLSSISHSLLTLAHSPLIRARKLSLSTSERVFVRSG